MSSNFFIAIYVLCVLFMVLVCISMFFSFMNFLLNVEKKKNKYMMFDAKDSKIIGRSFIKVSNPNLIKLLCFFLVAFVFAYMAWRFGFFVFKRNVVLDLASSDPTLMKEVSDHANKIASQSDFISNKKLIKQFLVFASLTVGSFIFVKIATVGSATAIVATSIGVSSSLSAIATGWILGSNLLFPETTSVAIAEKDVCTSVVTSVVTGVSIAAGATPTEAAETTSVIASIMDVVSEKDKLALDSVEKEPVVTGVNIAAGATPTEAAETDKSASSVAIAEKEPIPEKGKPVSGTGSSTTVTTSIATGAIAAVVTGVSIAAGATPTEAAAIGGASGVIAYKAITSGGFNYSKENWGRSILSSIITGAACGLATNSIMKVISAGGTNSPIAPIAPVVPVAPTENLPVFENLASSMLREFMSANLTIIDKGSLIKDDGRFFVVESLIEGEGGLKEVLGNYCLFIKQYISNIIVEISDCVNSAADGESCVLMALEITQLEDGDLIEAIKDVILKSNYLYDVGNMADKKMLPAMIEEYYKLD